MPERGVGLREEEERLDLAGCLIGAVCIEEPEEWLTGRSYLIMSGFFAWKRQHDADPISPNSSSEPMHQPASVAA